MVSEMGGKITPEGIQAFKNRIGVLIPSPDPWVTETHLDSVRHFAYSYGDDNPLFTDPAYGKSTRWGSVIAPPMLVSCMGETEVRKIPHEVRRAGAGALTGVPNYQSGSQWEWLRPMKPGDRVRQRYFISGVEEKRSEFGGGKAVIVSQRHEYINQRDEVAAVFSAYFFHVERAASEKKGKYMAVEPKVWTQDELDQVDEAYEKELRRGRETLYWEDVTAGMTMPVMVKGPLTTLDIICWHMGRGFGIFRSGPLRLGYLNRKRIPTFYVKNDYGHYDVAQRVHWDDGRARKVGNPRAYDYGAMRTAWIMHYLTNWIGDDGFVWKESDETRKFNYHGDAQWVKAKVTGKRQEEARNVVDLDVWCENQRGEVTTTGRASVLLPSRTGGPVVIPATDVKLTPLRTPYAVDWPGCVW